MCVSLIPLMYVLLSGATFIEHALFRKKKRKHGRSDFIIDEAEVDEDADEDEDAYEVSSLPRDNDFIVWFPLTYLHLHCTVCAGPLR